ncbi:MAG: imidazole glycerol phosphate synthase subunit HisH [Firmicutes bacterium]|jgi:glutamine amidotransferase|nr:imidazole glycerol phosphate synthase subunit HisH [Bacillota bacterium]
MNYILDYKLGNQSSLIRAFQDIDVEVQSTDDPNKLKDSGLLILPGVGAFRDAIDFIDNGYRELIYEHVKKGRPLLGVCLGMQLMYEKSYEYGEYEGLGIFKGEIRKLEKSIKVPHMGWNQVEFLKEDDIFKYVNSLDYFYYVHSYYKDGIGPEVIGLTDYGCEIPGVVRRDNVVAFQFHPEKSSKKGIELLRGVKEALL